MIVQKEKLPLFYDISVGGRDKDQYRIGLVRINILFIKYFYS